MLTFHELVDFVENRMRMSHIYQPLLIRTLVDTGGTATLRQAAMAFLDRDESQVRYYEDRIKRMPLPVLKRHGVVERDGDLIKLSVESLSYEQRADLVVLCEKKLGEFIKRRGMATWDYRLIETDPLPGDIRYRVLASAGGRCALCGATSKERRIEVDHVVPRSKGGTNEISNLQALCDECNRGKSNRDDQRFGNAE
jgi:5-methylcytosine-specific restriction endonuclease McrA